MSKHIPGPWVADIEEDGSIEVWSADYSMFIAKRHQMNDRDGAKANALLIAAAPELLVALEGIANATASSDGFDPFKAAERFQAIARAAIAKAKGE